jgi:energy-coupling factor transporter ATP-binding protein EcfA2
VIVLAIIEIENLSYTYPGLSKPSISDITLSIERGSFVTLTGPSGCGKTTLCRCINGLIPHFYGGEVTGEVTVSNLTVQDQPISELAQHVGFVFQNPENQLFSLSVEREIAFGLENLALPRQEMNDRLQWALDVVDIKDLRKRSPYELSGGQKQRVAIASVIAMKPKILIFDEPTSSLDPLAATELFKTISSLNKNLGLTIILVEHRLDLLSTLTNRVIVLDSGEVKMNGKPIDIFGSPLAKTIGIGIPKIVRLYQEIVNNGSSKKPSPLSVEDFANYVRSRI